MKTILCYGDSNVRGFIPGTFDIKTRWSERYPKSKRWTGILQNILGENYDVVEEGIGGRTTCFDEVIPGRPFRNGLNELPLCLESHYPIDLVVFMLGTNDTKLQFNCSAIDIAEGMRKLIHIVKISNKGPSMTIPKILVIAPQPILNIQGLHDQFDESSVKKSQELSHLYQKVTDEENCEFLDASHVVTSSKIDGIHLDEDQCNLL